MQKQTITRRRTPRSPRRRSQPRPILAGLADLIVPGIHIAWRAFWQGVELPRLVCGAVLLFPTLTLLVLLSHLVLPLAGAPLGADKQLPHQCILLPRACQRCTRGTPALAGITKRNTRPGGPAPAPPPR